MDSLSAYLLAVPKVELHLHLEGSITPKLARRLAARHGLAIPETYVEAASSPRYPNFRSFIALYLGLSACLRTVDDLADAIDDLAERLAAHNVRHAEVTFTPMTHHARGVAFETMWQGLREGRQRARTRGVAMRWVFDIVRTFVDQAEPTLSFTLGMERFDPGSVVGLGLGGPEDESAVDERLVAVFRAATAASLWAVPHAGELAGPASIRFALELGARRIGHGIRCLEDPELVAILRDRAIALEVCPTSNVALGVVPSWAEHPLPRLLEAGLAVTIGSDDPGPFATDVFVELRSCADTFGFTASQLRALISTGVEHAAMDEADRAALHAEIAAVPLPAD